jgi:hypothetical protein
MGESGKRAVLCLLASLIALLLAPAAEARGTVAIPRWQKPVSKGEAGAIGAFRAYAACLASAPQVELLLRTAPETAQEAALLRFLSRERKECRPNGQLRVLAYLLRGALAERLYLARKPSGQHAMSSGPPPEAFDHFTARLEAADRDGADRIDGKIRVWRWMAYCAAHLDPGAVAGLLKTAPSTALEVRAIEGLRPALDQCLPPAQWNDLSAVALRALVAEALFQRELAGTPPSPR